MKNKPEHIGSITGRNGTFPIIDFPVELLASDIITLDGISPRGLYINGGISVRKDIFAKKVIPILEEMGYIVTGN